MRPLHASYLQTRSLGEVRPLQAPLTISLFTMLGWCFLIRSYLCVSVWSLNVLGCVWFVHVCLDRTSETTAGILLENWVAGRNETTTSIPYHITVCFVGVIFFIRSSMWVSISAPKGSVCLWFVQFCLGRTSDTTAGILLENWVTGRSETTTSIPCYITVCFVGVIFSH